MSDKRFITIDPASEPLREVHNLLLSGVSPRPIALVSTISPEGVDNLAPFSFYNAFGANPPYVAFSPAYSGKDGSAKDTLINLEKTPECVIHAVPYHLVEQVNLASTDYGPEESEFIKAGFDTLNSELVKPKRVKASPFHMECMVERIIALGGTNGSGNLVLCRVVKFHVAAEIMSEGRVHPETLDLAGRNGLNYYTRASGSALFTVDKPTGQGMGIDQLPAHFRTSSILTGNDLGKLGSSPALPTSEETRQYLLEVPANLQKTSFFKRYEQGDMIRDNDMNQASELIHMAAHEALSEGETTFAMHILMTL